MTFKQLKEIIDEFDAHCEPDCKGSEVRINVGHDVLPVNGVEFFPMENCFVILVDTSSPSRPIRVEPR